MPYLYQRKGCENAEVFENRLNLLIYLSRWMKTESIHYHTFSYNVNMEIAEFISVDKEAAVLYCSNISCKKGVDQF